MVNKNYKEKTNLFDGLYRKPSALTRQTLNVTDTLMYKRLGYRMENIVYFGVTHLSSQLLWVVTQFAKWRSPDCSDCGINTAGSRGLKLHHEDQRTSTLWKSDWKEQFQVKRCLLISGEQFIIKKIKEYGKCVNVPTAGRPHKVKSYILFIRSLNLLPESHYLLTN